MENNSISNGKAENLPDKTAELTNNNFPSLRIRANDLFDEKTFKAIRLESKMQGDEVINTYVERQNNLSKPKEVASPVYYVETENEHKYLEGLKKSYEETVDELIQMGYLPDTFKR